MIFDNEEQLFTPLLFNGCPLFVAEQIVGGFTLAPLNDHIEHPILYVAGPMRNYPDNNFPAFDFARDAALLGGFHVISPADIDRKAGDANIPLNSDEQTVYVLRDFWSLFILRRLGKENGILLLPYWYSSVGAAAEFFLARWLGLKTFRTFAGKVQEVSIISLIKDFCFSWLP